MKKWGKRTKDKQAVVKWRNDDNDANNTFIIITQYYTIQQNKSTTQAKIWM